LTGEGIAVGLAQSEVLITALLKEDPVGYEKAWQRVTRKTRLLTSGLVRASQVDLLRKRLVTTAEHHPRLFDRLVQMAQ
jgi:hypothetical protein